MYIRLASSKSQKVSLDGFIYYHTERLRVIVLQASWQLYLALQQRFAKSALNSIFIYQWDDILSRVVFEDIQISPNCQSFTTPMGLLTKSISTMKFEKWDWDT